MMIPFYLKKSSNAELQYSPNAVKIKKKMLDV